MKTITSNMGGFYFLIYYYLPGCLYPAAAKKMRLS